MIHLVCPNPALDRTILINRFKKNSPNRPLLVREYPGGKSFNVAYALTRERKDIEVTIHTMLGGPIGEYVSELAQKNGYGITNTPIEENTRMCNIIIDTNDSSLYPIYERGIKLQDNNLQKFTNTLLSSLSDNDTIVFSGSFMKGFPTNYINQIKKNIKKENISLYVDTSGEHLKETLKCFPNLVKVNDEEIQEVFLNKKLVSLADYIDLLKYEITQEIPYFLITLGEKGVVARLNNNIYHISVPPIAVKNPVASGDFFLGILSQYKDMSNNHTDILSTAISYSTANCLEWLPEVDLSIVHDIKKQVKIENIKG